MSISVGDPSIFLCGAADDGASLESQIGAGHLSTASPRAGDRLKQAVCATPKRDRATSDRRLTGGGCTYCPHITLLGFLGWAYLPSFPIYIKSMEAADRTPETYDQNPRVEKGGFKVGKIGFHFETFV
ncbi:hypothetical protein Dimus_010975 [Dionaea muscipula]